MVDQVRRLGWRKDRIEDHSLYDRLFEAWTRQVICIVYPVKSRQAVFEIEPSYGGVIDPDAFSYQSETELFGNKYP